MYYHFGKFHLDIFISNDTLSRKLCERLYQVMKFKDSRNKSSAAGLPNFTSKQYAVTHCTCQAPIP